MFVRLTTVVIAGVFILVPVSAKASPAVTNGPLKVGLIASLSGFAAPYGVAVQEGVELALAERRKAGDEVELTVQDDQSDPTKALSAYRFLRDAKGVQLVVGGSWWIRPLAPITEREEVPLLSCETRQDKDFVPSKTYFILSGRVADWVREYEPLFRNRGMRRGASVIFTSGFGQSISDEMRRAFSTPGREFVGEIEYQDLQLSEARSIMLRLKRTHPDVAFVDGQPEGLATFLKRRKEMDMQSVAIVSHSAIDTGIAQKLVDYDLARNVYFLRRKPPTAEFSKRFQERYGRMPVLNADLGYSAGQMAVAALKTQDPLATLRKGMTVDGLVFTFDENQVADGIAQEIFQMNDKGEAVRVEVAGAGR